MGPDKVDRLCQKAQLAIAERDWDKAKQSYLMALGMRSDLPDVHYGLATVYFQQRELTSAAHHFREVTRLDPTRAGAFINLGAVLNVLQLFDEAVTALRRGIQLDNGRFEGYYNLGLVYKRKGQTELAVSAYREAIRLNPKAADAHLNLGNLYLEREQPKLAISQYEAAAQLRQGWDKALDALEIAREMLAAQTPGVPGTAVRGSSTTASVRSAPAAGSELDHLVDPETHAAFLTNLHNATIVTEETGRLLQLVVGEELEPAIKELSSVLMHAKGSRGELDGALGRLETALSRMRTAREALAGYVDRIEGMGEHFPGR
jgi:tetratricopeptide (TPR) repeat protein